MPHLVYTGKDMQVSLFGRDLVLHATGFIPSEKIENRDLLERNTHIYKFSHIEASTNNIYAVYIEVDQAYRITEF